MIEIFKTNVRSKRLAKSILNALHDRFPSCCFNFDLDDCDWILRVQSECTPIEIHKIIEVIECHSVEIYLFDD